MPLRDNYIRTAAHQAARAIRAQFGAYEQALAWVEQNMPGLSSQREDEIATGAVDIYHERLRRNTADEGQPAVDPTFRDNGWEAPGQVLVTVEFQGPRGARRYRSYRVPVRAGATLNDVREILDRMTQERRGEYPGWQAVNLVY